MSRADGGLRAEVQKRLPKPDWAWTPIESGGTHDGIPDSFWAHRPTRTSGWIEHKKTDGWAVEVRPHQAGWFRRHVAAGVRCVVAVRARGAGSSAGTGDSLWLVRGDAIELLSELGLRLPPEHVLGVWHGGPATWDWDAVRRILTD